MSVSRRAVAIIVATLAVLLVAAAQSSPDDPYFPQQWNLERIGAPEAWDVSAGQGVVVAVIDSGVDLEHPDLSPALARTSGGAVFGRDFVDGDDDPTDEHGHGTMVAGLVAARTNNGTAIASLAPEARIMPIRVLDEDAAGTSEDVDAAIRWAVDNGADVINLSLEVAHEEEEDPPLPVGGEDDDTDDAVRYAWDRGVAVVAAAGNDSASFTDYTRDTPVLIVGATDRDDRRAGFSDTGREDAVMAPGVHIVSTWCDPCGQDARHAVGMSEGTSYAAPQVSGTLALLRAAGLTSEQAVQRVRDTAVDVGDPGPDRETGRGRIDTAAALGITSSPAPSPSATTAGSPSETTEPDREAAGGTPASQPSPDTPGTADGSPSPSPTPTEEPPPEEPQPTPSETGPAPQAENAQAAPATRRWAVFAGVLILVDLAALAWFNRRRLDDAA